MLLEKIVISSIGCVLIGGLTTSVYQDAKDEKFKNTFTNVVLLINIICFIAFPLTVFFG